MVWAEGCQFHLRPAEIESVIVIERNIRLAEIRILEQLRVDRGTGGKNFGELQAELGDIFDLILRADQVGGAGEGLGAEVMLGMDVGGDKIKRARAGELFGTS